MPVVAVVGGVMSASAGLGAIAAAGGVAAMGAASIGSLVVAGLQVVGGVASALGAVTGNEKLMKVGMVASLGASAVSAVSSLGSASSSAGSVMDGATGVAKNATPSYADFAAQTSGGGTYSLNERTRIEADLKRNADKNSGKLQRDEIDRAHRREVAEGVVS